MKIEADDVVGYVEIVARAHETYGVTIPADTARSWEKRRAAWEKAGRPVRSASRPDHEPLPDPIAASVNGSPAWLWSQIGPWLERTGKTRSK
ncbi:hypothetical protein IMZ11_33810 [Microtetraspora sp. AC03309]|uniref:hypothetical protein n=1 Tax=Microtetraspora sp. AC03309 TaxID=2779376 RepID=UPI001E4FB9D5|nr:hypothetical protein [Microtetraspora sp. AC03309]MCC5580606.1 hypothetical protein [Microtetraspora sp. AC03309]